MKLVKFLNKMLTIKQNKNLVVLVLFYIKVSWYKIMLLKVKLGIQH